MFAPLRKALTPFASLSEHCNQLLIGGEKSLPRLQGLNHNVTPIMNAIPDTFTPLLPAKVGIYRKGCKLFRHCKLGKLLVKYSGGQNRGILQFTLIY